MSVNRNIGLINQSVMDESQINTTMDEQPSFLIQKPNYNNSGKWKASDIYAEGIAQYIKQNSKEKLDQENDMSFGSAKSIENMKANQLEVFSTQLHKEYYQNEGKLRAYVCVFLMIMISIVNNIQRASINYMYNFPPPHSPHLENGTQIELTAQQIKENKHYCINQDISNLTPENFMFLVGDFSTIVYAFMVLFTGSASDLMNRKHLLLGSCFGWSACIYFCSFANDFETLNVLKLVMSFFCAISGPCSYSLITDWVPPENRIMAYSLYAMGVQFASPMTPLNSQIIDWLGWRGSFQFQALLGFLVLAFCIIAFDEPERGRFDINQSVMNNPDESYKNNSAAYQLSEDPTHKRLQINNIKQEQESKLYIIAREYFKAVLELFVNPTANWVLLAACLRTTQSIALGQFTDRFFTIYNTPEYNYDYEFYVLSQIATIVGSFICTMGTAIICDMYDNYNYMTKAYICIYTTLISIPCSCMIYLCTSNFWISMAGYFIENLLSSGWGQPAIGILSSVCDPNIRGTAVSIFFFMLTIFGLIVPKAFSAIQNYYGIEPEHEPVEFGIFIALFTIIPCILAIPCFYIAGVKYSWYKYHEAMFMLDVWNEMEQWYQDDISKKRFQQMQMNGGPQPDDPTNLSVSVDWKIIRDQRKLKVKNLKDQNLNLKNIKPFMKKRQSIVKQHGFAPDVILRKKSIIANLIGDETQKDFPDTRSQANDESFQFQKYSESYDGRNRVFHE